MQLYRQVVALVTLSVAVFIPGCERDRARAAASASAPARVMLTVAAAADLTYAFDELANAFHRQHPDLEVRVSFSSSGSFFSQIVSGAPFDLFLSADQEYPRRLVTEGLAEPDGEFVYALGRIVGWTRQGPLRARAAGAVDLLLDPAVHRIALANPAHAPYGRAAESALKNLGVYDRVRDRLVFGENVAQAAQFVETGAADVGLIARALAVAPPIQSKGQYWDVPEDAHPPLRQTGVILKRTRDSVAAAKFRDFILSAAGRTILQRYGFDPPDE